MHPKYSGNGTVSRVFPLIALIALGAFCHSTPGSAQKWEVNLVKRGKVVGEGTGPKGESGGKDEGERVGGKGPESALETL